MLTFPSLWQLLLPNLNLSTIIGIILIVLAFIPVVSDAIAVTLSFIIEFFGIRVPAVLYKVLMIFIGIVLIWGISIFQDYLKSTGGALVFWCLVTTLFIGVIIFWPVKKKR